MTVDLKTQIGKYASYVEREQEPVSVDRVLELVEDQDDTVVRPRPQEPTSVLAKAPWPAVIAAAVVLVIFGVFAWVFPGDEPPAADSLPDPMDRELGYYVPSAVPEGFVLQDMQASEFGSSLTYIRDVESRWLPGDGGFSVSVPFISPAGLPEDPDAYLNGIVEVVPGASRVEVGGLSGVIRETAYEDGPVTTSLVRLLVVDEHGSVYEIASTGMSQEEVLLVGEGIERVPVDEFVSLGSQFDWELRVSGTHEGFQYETPQLFEDLASDVRVVIGEDVLSGPGALARSEIQEAPVITTDDGSIVEPQESTYRSSSVDAYLNVSGGDLGSALEALAEERVGVSPTVSERLIDDYLNDIAGAEVISESPFVIRAPVGPMPQFDTAAFGEELALEPAVSLDVLPDWTVDPTVPGEVLPSTTDRPIVVVGTVRQPDSEAEPVTPVLWFTELPFINIGLATGQGIAQGGGAYPLDTFGIGLTGSSQEVGSNEIFGRLSYSVPLETAVVQVVTEIASYWQRPRGGYGAISWGETVDRPISIVAVDAEGVQLGEWEVPQD